MATLDLGKIKQVWRGTYNNGTAYVVDDLVAYTDSGITSTYICVANSTGNAPSSSGTAHASWNYVAKGVVDPIPSQSGNSGKFIKTDGSSLSFADAGGVKQMKVTTKTTSFSTSTNFTSGFVDVTGLSVTITPTSTASRILLLCNAVLTSEENSGGLCYLKVVRNVGGGSFSNIAESTDSGSYRHAHAEIEAATAYGHVGSTPLGLKFFDHPNTTSAVIYKVMLCTNGSNTAVIGRSGRADSNNQDIKHATQLMAIEIDGGIL